MRIDLNCPAELWRYELPREDYRACTLILYNLSVRLIASCEVTLVLLDKEGEELSRLIYRARDLHGVPQETFSVPVPVESPEDVSLIASCELTIEKLWYDNGMVWRREKGSMVDVPSNALPRGKELEELRFLAGHKVVGYPARNGNLWVCICGRPNEESRTTCVRCHREQQQVFAEFAREVVQQKTALREQQLELQAKAAREDASRRQMMREQEYMQRKARQKKRLCIILSLTLVVVLALGTVFGVLPYLKYREATQDMENGLYQEASIKFSALGRFPGAQDGVTRCSYLLAVQQLDSGDVTQLLQAKETFLSLGEYEDASAQAVEADYRLAGLYLDADDTAGAKAIYTALGDYKDSAARISACDYRAAELLLDSGSYIAARTAFEALGDYQDAAARALEAGLKQAEKLIADKTYDEAIEQLKTLGNYEPADALIKQCYYLKAGELEHDGSYEEAAACYALADSYLDAAEKRQACLYLPAAAALEAGDHAAAMELFAQIPGYSDADEKWRTAAYLTAQDAMKAKDYARACTILAQLPEDWENVAELKLECSYRTAVAKAKSGEYEEAIELFTALGDYSDSKKQVSSVRYAYARHLKENGQLAEAAEQYVLLGTYSNSARLLKSVRYALGKQQAENGQWDDAEATFLLLGSYRDAATWVKRVRYSKADALLTAGDTAGAREIFESLGKYEDARQKVLACDYAAAQALADSGAAEAAAEAFAALGSYSDAKQQAQQLYYALAVTAAADGSRMLEAARYYLKAGDWSDAPQQAEALFDALYAEAYVAAQDAMDNGEYAEALELLGQPDPEMLPKKYAGMYTLWQEANYRMAVALEEAGKPFEALAYYQQIPDYRNVNERLNSYLYLLAGAWTDQNGVYYEFRTDNTCTMGDEVLCYQVRNYSLLTGETADTLQQTHRVSNINGNRCTLRDVRNGGNRLLTLVRVELPVATGTDLSGD